ncbi:extracellular solute-binding protein [Streptomyces sp. NPDC058525]|uniref:extracellular solute-binding protein n=1 Tax=Streptomyces sp. NPDC058525 TaxID=3346538 RepID=UPI00365D2E74
MKRRHHVLTTTATALVLSVSSAGCANVDDRGEVTLRLVAADYEVADQSDSTERYWADLIAAFESAHTGITVEVEIVPWDRVDRHVAAMVKTGHAPDVAQIASYAEFAARGELYSADQLLSVPVEANFLPQFAAAGQQERTQYGMPFSASTRLLLYNQNLFAEAGVDEPPATWDELRAAATQLKSRTDAPYPMAVPLGPEEAQIEAMTWILGGGGGYTGSTGRYTIDSQQNIDSLTWLKENLVEKGLTGPVRPERLNRKEAYAAFVRGEVGMVNGPLSLLRAAKAAGIKVGTTPMPGRVRDANDTPAVVDWIMAFKRNGHRAELGNFLDYLFSDKNVREFAIRNNLLPVTVSVTNQMETDAKHEDLRAFLRALPTSVSPPLDKISWASVSNSTKKNIGSAMSRDGSPAEALRRVSDVAIEAERAP